MWKASVAGGLVLSCLAFGMVMNSASLVVAVGAAAFGAVAGALLGAGIHLTWSNAREMPRRALGVSGILLCAVIIVVVDDHVRYAHDAAFLADIDSTRGVFYKLDPDGHDRISVRYVVKELVYTSQENGPKPARDYRGGDSVTVYFRRAHPSHTRFVRPMAHRLSWWLILGLWILGYVFLLGVGGSFARGMRNDVVPRPGAT